MPKKKKSKEKKLDEKEYLGVKYEIWDNGKELEYRVVEGLKPFKIKGATKRSLTIQIKKDIEMNLKAQDNSSKESESESLEDMSEKELGELFDPDNYKDDEDDEPEIVEIDKTDSKVVGKAMAHKTVEEQVEEFSEKMGDVHKQIMKEKPELLENLSKDSPLTPEEIASEEEAERLEAEAGGAFENISEDDVYGAEDDTKLSKGEEALVEALEKKVDVAISVVVNIEHFPKTKQKGELKFIVREGKLYGQISNQTFVTIEKNRFQLIPATTYTNMRKGRTIRVMPLDIMHIPDDYDYELTFRFLVINNQHEIGKTGGRMCIKVRNQDTDLRIDQGCVFDPHRFTALNIPNKVKFVDFDKLIPSGPMKYPMGQFERVENQIMFIDEDHRYDKELFQMANKVFEFKNTKTMISPNNRILILMTTDEKMGILLAALGEEDEDETGEPEEEIKEIEDEIDEMFEEEE